MSAVRRYAPIGARLLAALGLLPFFLVLGASRVFADNCDLTINPLDCQNTAWVIGGIASAAAGAAGAAAAAGSMGRGPKFSPVDDAAVQRDIDDALKKASGDPKKAWLDLTSRREQNCYDMSLAAAEHYLFARYLVVDTIVPAPVAAAMVVAYELYKAGSVWAVPTGDCPATPASAAVVEWGLSGVADGIADVSTPTGP